MNNPQFPEHENARINALHRYNILDTAQEADFDRITRLASIICETPISLISLVDVDRQWFKARTGLDVTETPRDIAFCHHAILDTSIFEVEDAIKDERFRENALVTGNPNIRFYAGQPLLDPDGYALGTLCVIDREPRQLTEVQREGLRLLATEVMNQIVERRQKEELRNFERLFLTSHDLLCILGLDGFLKKVNNTFQTIFGWSDDIVLTTIFLEFVHPDDKALTLVELGKLAKGKSSIGFVARFRAQNGSYKVIQWTSTPELGTNNVFCVGRDITENRRQADELARSEQMLRVFFEHSQGLMCTHNLAGHFLSVNNSGAQELGYSVEELLQCSLFDITPPANHLEIKQYLAEIAAKGIARGHLVTLDKRGKRHVWIYNNVVEYPKNGSGPYVIGNAIDITERQRLERDLKRTKEFLEETNAVARVGGWELIVAQQKLHWTEVTRQIHGCSPDYVPSLETGIQFYKEGYSRDTIIQAVNDAINYGTPYDVELQIINVEGSEIWVRAMGNAEFKDGKCFRLLGTFQDINARKIADLERNTSRKLLQDVLHAATTVAIISCDKNGIISVFNNGAEKMLGYTAEEMVGKTTPALLHIQSEIDELANELKEEYGVEVAGFDVFVYRSRSQPMEEREWTYVKKDGTKITVSLVVTTMRYDNEITGYLGIATDITERKKAEKELFTERSRLRAFVEHAPAAVAMLDRNMRYIAVSERWLEEYKMLGQNIIGASHYEVFPNITDEWRAVHHRCLQGAIEKNDEDIWRPPHWDQDQILRWEVRPWMQFDGTIGGIMMFTQDITEAHAQREELKRAKLQAEEASVAKSEFLANMSHEIRTPLNGVIGFTDLVLKTQLNETQKQYLSIVNQSGNSLLGIINDILDFSKIEAGKLELDIEKCDIYEIGSQSTDIITYSVQKKGLELLLNISPDLPRYMFADANRLKQILVNLLGNAAKFTEKGEIELKIQILSSVGNKALIRFMVRDTGIGIRPDKQEKIFEAFSQEDGSTTKKYGGTGLGLTISNKLLGLMGSRLYLESILGKGSTFYFDLSLQTEEGEPLDWGNTDHISNVLIVDDNEHNRLILKQMLTLKNIRTVEARSGFEALQKLTEGQHFDTIFMDYHMPYMDGIETVRKIRQSFSGNQDVIFLYSSADDGRINKACEELDVRQRLVKPLKMQDIFHALSKVNPRTLKDDRSKQNTVVNSSAATVLVVEDNSVNMLLASTIFSQIAPNAKVIEAYNGAEAVRWCTDNTPDIIFMDVQMPVMNGYEATIAIRAMPQHSAVPIVALTAGSVKGEREKCLAAGMNDFIVKPVKEDGLAAMFQKWMGDGAEDEPNAVDEEPTNNPELHFDLEKFKDKVGDDPEILTEFFALIDVELEKAARQIEDHYDQRDLTSLNALGHRLYGTSLSMELPQMAALARELEGVETFNEIKLGALKQKLLSEIADVTALVRQ